MKSLTLAALLALLALPLPALGHEGQHTAPLPMQVSRATERIVLPDIPVTDQRGMTQGFLSRYGPRGPLLVSFLYTNCTEVCLMTQATLGDLDRDLAGPGAPPLTILSITVDPARDTPEVLARSRKRHGGQREMGLAARRAIRNPSAADRLRRARRPDRGA